MPKTAKNLEKKVTFRLKDDDYAFFKALVEKEGYSVSSAVRRMVMSEVTRQKRLFNILPS